MEDCTRALEFAAWKARHDTAKIELILAEKRLRETGGGSLLRDLVAELHQCARVLDPMPGKVILPSGIFDALTLAVLGVKHSEE